MKILGLVAAALLACLPGQAIAAPERGAVALQDEVLVRINFARQHPREYAQMLRTYRTWFKGHVLYLPGDRNGVYLEEGTAAVDEAIAFMERQAPLGPLSRADLLGLAAQDHANEQGPRGMIGHGSPDGASPGERVRRRGGDIYVGENISYGFADPDEVVRQFIVDDGVADRGHRHALFDADYKFAGVGCAPHTVYQHMCVVDMSATRDGRPDTSGWPPNVRLASADTGAAQRWVQPAAYQQPSFQQAAFAPEDIGQDDDSVTYEVTETIEVSGE